MLLLDVQVLRADDLASYIVRCITISYIVLRLYMLKGSLLIYMYMPSAIYELAPIPGTSSAVLTNLLKVDIGRSMLHAVCLLLLNFMRKEKKFNEPPPRKENM